jgi:hypothetical protein
MTSVFAGPQLYHRQSRGIEGPENTRTTIRLALSEYGILTEMIPVLFWRSSDDLSAESDMKAPGIQTNSRDGSQSNRQKK